MTLRHDPERDAWLFTYQGEERELADPDGPASGRQLSALNRAGLLAIRPTRHAPITKLDAARLIDKTGAARKPGPDEPTTPMVGFG